MRAPLIELAGVDKSYRNGEVVTPVLHGIDLSIGSGEHVALMGPSGSGKSTLMNLLGLLDRADAGRQTLAGQDVTGLAPAEQAEMRNRTIGFVFQGFNLLKRMTVAENVALPLLYAGASRAAARTRALELLAQVGLAELDHRLPSQLSGGQQQRVAIARALANRPPLLLADEPTGNLDTQTTEDVLALLDALNREQGLTIVIVTHENDVAAHAARLVRLKDGRIVSDQARAPTLASFAAPRGGAGRPWDGPAESHAPTLASFAAPRGGAGRPWDGPAESHAPTLTSFAAPRGGAGRPWDGPADGHSDAV